MGATDKQSKANDYAVAMELNKQVVSLMLSAAMIVTYDMTSIGTEISKLNRAYILLAAELQKIYDRNSVLSSISPEPMWKQFDMLKGNFNDISDYLVVDDDGNSWVTHNDKLERLYILSGESEPEFSVSQKQAIEDSENAFGEFKKYADEASKKLEKNNSNPEYIFQIPDYFLKYKPDGTIEINRALKLKKVHAGSITERLLEQAFKNPNTKFKPDLGKTSRNISTIISSAGFTPVLRDLFFPTISADGIVFRPFVTRLQAGIENIDTEELDELLKMNGALCVVITEPN